MSVFHLRNYKKLYGKYIPSFLPRRLFPELDTVRAVKRNQIKLQRKKKRGTIKKVNGSYSAQGFYSM